MDIDPAHGAVPIDDERRRHRDGRRTVDVDLGEVKTMGELSGKRVRRRGREDPERAGDLIPGSDSTAKVSSPFSLMLSEPSGFCGLIATRATPRASRIGLSSDW